MNIRKTAQLDTIKLFRRRMFRAVVTSTSPFEIKREDRSDAESASRLNRYAPALNDLVIVIQVGPRLVVLDKEVP